MASPQIENGYTPIANEIMDALARTRIPGEVRQVLDYIFRKTYGWNKKEDVIPMSQFVKSTGLKKPNICRALSKLITMCIIKKDNRNGNIAINIVSISFKHRIAFNFNYYIKVPGDTSFCPGLSLPPQL